MITSRAHTHERGFSLVELMVAMVVSLILLAGILQILLGNRDSFEVQKAVASLQQDARLASFVLENAIAHAGYRVELRPDLDRIFPQGFIDGTDGDGDGAEPDAIRIRFQADGGLSDCLGSPDAPDLTDFRLFVDTDDELKCVVFDAGAVDNIEPLINNIETLQIRYGLDANGDNAVDTYTNEFTAAQSFDVRSVRIQLLLVSDGNVRPAPVAETFTFADGQTLTFDDRRARQMVDQTIALRNLLP